MEVSANPNVLSGRYATPEINEIFSEVGGIISERELWIAVLRAQRELGVDIPSKAIEEYEKAKEDVDLERIREIERETRHDVVARTRAFNEAAGGLDYIHRGMTSKDLTDNVDQMLSKKAGEVILGRYVSVLRQMNEKAEEYASIELTARTHNQPAQVTLLGRRFSMWEGELLLNLKGFENFLDNYPLRGIKGPVGTQSDMLKLLGDEEKVERLEKKVAESLGFEIVLDSPGQIYPRSLDYALVSHLALLSAACENFSKGMISMAGFELVTEGFKEGQVGSSAMPHKMNTRSSERIYSLAELVKMYAEGASRISGQQSGEGDVSDSALRRVVIPNAFYASDGICETTLTILNEMGTYPVVISKELDKYLPFLATTEILEAAIENGMGREEAHEKIKLAAIKEALRMREKSGDGSEFVSYLVDQGFVLREDSILAIIANKTKDVGSAHRQIEAVSINAQAFIKRYSEQAKYEPGAIL